MGITAQGLRSAEGPQRRATMRGMTSDVDPRSLMHGLHALVGEIDRMAATIDRSLAHADAVQAPPAGSGVDDPRAGEFAEVRDRAHAALRGIAVARPRVLALIAEAHGPGPRD
jgi:hypothetical protein